MTFWTFQERIQALTPPPNWNKHFRLRKKWDDNQREALGFTSFAYDKGIEFCRAKTKKGVAWLLIDKAQHCEITQNLGARGEGRDSLVWNLNYQEAGLLAEGIADSEEDAWAAACTAAGTDRLEIGQASQVQWLKKARAALKEFDRLAGLQPEEAGAKVQRYVYAEGHYGADDGWHPSEEYCARRRRFCYRRFRLVKEAKLFYFCDLQDSETIDRNGEVDEEAKLFTPRRSTDSLTRVRKDLWDKPVVCGGEEADTSCRYISNGPYGVHWLWLSLESIVAEVEARQARYLRTFAIEGISWANVLGIDLDDRELSGITGQELKRFYRRAVHKAHPDKEGGSAEQFQAVQEAYAQAKRAVKVL